MNLLISNVQIAFIIVYGQNGKNLPEKNHRKKPLHLDADFCGG
ncbi:hypothetical protein KIS1582_4518 [Cytobacillus firmus]|uniref:Uncharacterized protein n=1 Tax=Cytobacillus firmus TaxID=1399 RepID=A0A800N8D3_CYTFI|nr:hypothetical protein KIS1582_4518 [Cytobacillus firmus]